jgi:hypothetical protein
MDAGNLSFSDNPTFLPSIGTSTNPPPAPNKPLTAPAAAPAMDNKIFLDIKIASCGEFSHRRYFICMYYSFIAISQCVRNSFGIAFYPIICHN